MLLCFLWCLNVVMHMWRSSRQSLHFSVRVKQARGKWELQSLSGQTCLYRSSLVAEQNRACLQWVHTKSGDDAPRVTEQAVVRPCWCFFVSSWHNWPSLEGYLGTNRVDMSSTGSLSSWTLRSLDRRAASGAVLRVCSGVSNMAAGFRKISFYSYTLHWKNVFQNILGER